MDHTEVLHALAEATSKAQHKRAISAATPTAGKALVRIAAELARHGHGPKKPLAQAQLRLLLHPDSTHGTLLAHLGVAGLPVRDALKDNAGQCPIASSSQEPAASNSENRGFAPAPRVSRSWHVVVMHRGELHDHV